MEASRSSLNTDKWALIVVWAKGDGGIPTAIDRLVPQVLGSVYAMRDFFKIDPRLITPPKAVDLIGLVSEGLIRDEDQHDLLDGISTFTGTSSRAEIPKTGCWPAVATGSNRACWWSTIWTRDGSAG